MSEEQITTEKLRETADSIEASNKALTGYVNEVVAKVKSVKWTGKAADTFRTTFDATKAKLDAVGPILVEYSQFLRETADAYELEEAQRESENASVED